MKSGLAVLALLGAFVGIVSAQIPASQHVVVVVEENHDYSQVIGSGAMPYLNSLTNQYGLATQYYADTHPSIGNYFMMTTGQIITNNDNYNSVVTADNLVRHLLAAGKTWKSYAEGLPSVGYVGGDTGEYVRHHNPFTYLSDVYNSPVQKLNLVPFTQFATDLNNNALSDISFIIPNLIDDAHDGTLQQADAWLQSNIAPLLTNSAFQQDGILIVVFDESAGDNTHGGGRVATVVVGPEVIRGGQSATLYQHENLLRTISEAVGLTTFPGAAATASDMHDLFLQVVVSPARLTFGSQLVGTTSASQGVTLTNNQTSAVTGISITTAGDFAQSNNCGTSLAANASCTINVTFTPTAVGTRTGTLTVTDSAGTQTASLSGTGVANVSLTPSMLPFGSQGVGTTSSPQAATLTNGQTVAVTAISVSITGTNASDFAQTNNCGTSLAANSSCTINVTFTPSTYGAESATLSVTDSAGTQTSSLTGTGKDITPPTTQITAPANGATVSSVVTVTATASDNVGVTSIQIYIDGTQAASGTASPLNYSWNTANVTNGTHTIFSKAFDAAGNLGTSATITVTVNNSVQQLLHNTGFETGNLTSWNAGGVYLPVVTSVKHNTGSYSAQLGSSVTPEPNGDSWLYQTVTIPSGVTAASLNFSYWGVCNDTLSNDWQEAQIQSASGTTLAQVMKVCNTSSAWTRVYFNLINYAGQTIRIYFNDHGNGNGLLTYMYVDDVTVSVRGGANVTLSPASVSFGNQNVGTTSSSHPVTLANNQSSALTGVSVSITGTNASDFAESDNCGTSVAANSTCTINVTFTPSASGTRSATLTVTDSAGTQTSTLSGTGVGSVTLTPASLTFGNQNVGTTSSPQPLTLTNGTASALTGISVSVTGTNSGDFAQTNNCGTTIAANSSCTVNVKFTPTAAGTRTATVTVTDSAGSQTASLSGTGVSNVTLTPSSVGFGNQGVGTTSSAQPVTLSNGNGSALTGVSVSITGTNAGDFGQTNNCGTSVAANSSCTINVTFTPTGYGARSAILTVNDSAGTQTSSLSGTGTDVTAPTTQIAAPANGATVSGTVTVTATASDNVGVTSIQIYIDGAQVATGTASPLNYSWNTANVSNGTHAIYSKASDAAGNVGTSTTITVTVNNGVSQLIQNPGFETGNLANWIASGAYLPFVATGHAHSGTYSAELGASVAPEPTSDTATYQTVTIPSNPVGASLNYYYRGLCADVVANDWQEAQIQNTSGVKLAQVMKVCDNSGVWTHVYYNLMPFKGQTVRIYFNTHQNGNGLLTYMYLDDVTVSVK